MKIITSFFLVFFCTSVLAQYDVNSFVISKFEKENDNAKVINELFDLNQSDTLLSLNNYKFIKLNNKSVTLYKTKQNQIIFKKEYNRKELNKKLNFNFLFNLNPVELTINEVDGKKIEVNDGSEYSIKVFKKNKYLEFLNYAPDVYIENKYPFFEKRKFFLDCYISLDSLFFDDLFLKVQNAEEVFIKFEDTEYTSKKVLKNKNILDGKEIYYINEMVFSTINETTEKINSKMINQKIVIDYDFLNQYFPQELKKLLKENKKKIFMIEKCKKSKKKVIISQVKFNN